MYRWYSTMTGEVVPDFRAVLLNISENWRVYRSWTLRMKLEYMINWKYRKEGF